MRTRRPRSFALGWTMLAGLGLGGILTHFASEFFGMGGAAWASLLTPRHAYLALAAAVCILTIVVRAVRFVRATQGPCDLRRRLTNKREALPLHGRGAFIAAAAGLQFAAGVGSAVGEGCLFCGHDVAAAIVGALLTAFVLALVLRLLAARLPSLARSVCLFLTAAHGSRRHHPQRRGQTSADPAGLVYWSAQVGNRPPPLHALAPA